MAHLLCRYRNGFKKWKTQAPAVVVYAVTIFCVVGFCFCGRTNICSSYSSSECKRMELAFKANEDYLQRVRHHEDYLQRNSNRNKIWKLLNMTRTSISGTRRLLSGPGSSPPRCASKCGRCVPCKPVHVTVPPGIPVTTEYYAEAWRCKCGNKLYMPY